MSRRRPSLPRLIDLHVPWMLQYVVETTQHDPADYPAIGPRLGRLSGYLSAVSAAIIPAERSADDWSRQADPWAALGLSIARIEAEFAGRILADPADLERWRNDPNGLTWAVLGIGGLEALVREPSDLDRLPALIERGARAFRPIERPGGLLGGSSAEADDRGLEPLGLDCLNVLLGASPKSSALLIDLAPMSARCRDDVLAWLEADGSRPDRLVPVLGPVSLVPDRPDAPDDECLRRLRALGGFLGLGAGPPFHDTTEQLRESLERAAAIPFQGEPGPKGIGIATHFLGGDGVTTGLETAEAIIRWLTATFDEEQASAWIRGNGEALVARICGGSA